MTPGTIAVYRPVELSDVRVTVRCWSSLSGYLGLVLRYRDILHYDVFYISVKNWAAAYQNGVETRLGGQDSSVFSSKNTYPGRTLSFEARGTTLTASIDDNVVGTFEEPDGGPGQSGTKGRVGLWTHINYDANFDDFTIEAL